MVQGILRRFRPLPRLAARGVCLLCLPACLAAAALWGHAVLGYFDTIEVTAAATYVSAGSTPQGLSFGVARRWPGQRGVFPEFAARDEGRQVYVFESDSTRVRTWSRLGLRGYWGGARFWADGGGMPVRVPRRDATAANSRRFARTPPLPCWDVEDVPHGWAVLATAVPPAAWLGRRLRRGWVRDRRWRAGRCLGCGYSLAHNTTGVCPECGASVVNGPPP